MRAVRRAGRHLAVVLGVLLVAVAFAVIGGARVRHRSLTKLGVRNLTRRPGRSAIIVSGLMLGTTIIGCGARLRRHHGQHGPVLGHQTLGQTDEIVSARSGEAPDIATLGEGTAVRYLSADEADAVVAARAPPPPSTGWPRDQRGRRGPGHQQPDQRAPADALRHRPDRCRGSARSRPGPRTASALDDLAPARPTSTTRPRTRSTPRRATGSRVRPRPPGAPTVRDIVRYDGTGSDSARAADAVGAGPAAALRRRPGAARPRVQRRRRRPAGPPAPTR